MEKTRAFLLRAPARSMLAGVFSARGALAALALAGLGLSGQAWAQDKPKAEVMHWWTSGGEAAAVKVFADQYTKAGGVWVDSAVAGGQAARSAAINRIVGGNPPTASQFNTGKQFDDLVSQGLLNTVDQVAEEGKWKSFLPPSFIEAASREGHMYAVPVNVHGQNWAFYSKDVLDKSGVTAVPTNWDDFIVVLDKIKAAGFIPLAQGGEPWQERLLFNVVLQSVSKDTFMRLYAKNDATAIDTPEFKKSVEIFGKLRGYTDAGSPGRNWNDTTALLITNKAGVQFMGDWAKGEFKAANKEAGKDFYCQIGIDDKELVIGGDVFVFPKTTDAAQIKAQNLLASTMLSPETQVLFNVQKGSMPVRTDVDASKFDLCAQKGMKLLADPTHQTPVIDMLASADLVGALEDVITNFWNNKSQTPEEFTAKFADALKSAQ
ncbi:ABC transporter substrate-binding protein [Labrys sp. WJW]|uniref:ABC transporter substrate-binding protein n=1 Tax=Labrys sp. WJW TaxID=1737983 RepID=UPI000AEEB174|nr:ABC transporter substrate-binding protein [Labrys sp. WJW]